MWAEWNYKETVTRDLCLCLIGFNAKSTIEEEKLQQKLPEGVRVRVWQEGSFYNIVYRTDMDSNISYSYLDPLIELGYIDELEYISG
jgi:hypothetical protein